MEETKSVLVVEDNPALANVVRYNLEQLDLDVEVARNGREAWDRLQVRKFDCVITDYQMPEMDGYELCRRMRQSPDLAATPVMLLTAKELELDACKMIHDLAITRIWPKPFSPTELCAAVTDVLAPAPTVA